MWRKGYEKGLYPQETFCNACGTRDRREGLEADKQDQQVMGIPTHLTSYQGSTHHSDSILC